MTDSNVTNRISLVSNDNAAVESDALPSSSRDLSFGQGQLVELFTDFRDAGAAGFALAQIPRSGRVLWIQDRMAALETGRPFGSGCEWFGCSMDRLVLVCTRNTADLLWAIEEALRCTSFAAIIGEVFGNPRVMDFTASKRLAVRAERQAIPVFLLRINAQRDLSAARRRWEVRSLPSAPHPHDLSAPGAPRWHIDLFRARDMKPNQWIVQYDRATHRLDMVSSFRDGAVDAAAGDGSVRAETG